jgi:NitT/TauT family transport system permease protein
MQQLPLRLKQMAVMGALLATIELISVLGFAKPTTMPAPHNIFLEFVDSLASGSIFPHLRATGERLVLALGICILGGTSLGMAFWRVPTVGKAVQPVLAASYGVPFIFFYPVLILVLGIGNLPIVFLAVTIGIVPLVLNTFVGMMEIRPVFLKIAAVSRASRRQTFFKVLLPAAAPYMISGLKLTFIYTFLGVVSTEFLLSSQGLGFIVRFSYDVFKITEMYAYIVFMVLLAFSITFALNRTERALRGRLE